MPASTFSTTSFPMPSLISTSHTTGRDMSQFVFALSMRIKQILRVKNLCCHTCRSYCQREFSKQATRRSIGHGFKVCFRTEGNGKQPFPFERRDVTNPHTTPYTTPPSSPNHTHNNTPQHKKNHTDADKHRHRKTKHRQTYANRHDD